MNKGSFASLIPTELVERLSAATVGSRELDAQVFAACGFRERRFPMDSCPYWVHADTPDCIVSPDKERLTTSLDAALALAERVLGGKNALHLLADLLSYEAASSDFDLVTVADVPRQLCIAILKALPTNTPSEKTPSTSETEERG